MIRSTLANDPDLAALLAAYVAELPHQARHLRDLLDRGDAPGLCRLLHEVKGTAGGFGFRPLTLGAGAAEQVLLSNHPHDQVRRQIDDLIRLLRHVEGYDIAREDPC